MPPNGVCSVRKPGHLADVHRAAPQLLDAAHDRARGRSRRRRPRGRSACRSRRGSPRRGRRPDDRDGRAERLLAHELGICADTWSSTGGMICAPLRSPPRRSRRAVADRARRRAARRERRPRSSISVPTSVAASNGSPTRAPRVRRDPLDELVGDRRRDMIRFTAVQRWPLFRVAPLTARSAASSRSASARTISGSLPPSSSTVRR